jgi:hypothetical protein
METRLARGVAPGSVLRVMANLIEALGSAGLSTLMWTRRA